MAASCWLRYLIDEHSKSHNNHRTHYFMQPLWIFMKKIVALTLSIFVTFSVLPAYVVGIVAIFYSAVGISDELHKVEASLQPADNPAYLYTGRIDFTDPKKPYLTWPGSSIKAQFSGSELAITMDDELGQNYYNVIIDKQNRFPTVIGLKKGTHTYTVATGLALGIHNVEIFKRTEGTEGGSHFLGLTLSKAINNIEAGKLLTKPAPLTRRIEFYGDSITSGMGNEAIYNSHDKNGFEKNHYLSYAAITARMLNAEHHSISHSGIGVMYSWFDYIMPEYFNQLSAVGNNDTRWDFLSWKADVIVINLTQNDSWLVKSKKHVEVAPTESEIVKHYVDFVQTIRSKYPQALIVCALGSMNATQQGSPWPGYIKLAIEHIKYQEPDARISSVMFDYNGFKKHPRVAQHHANATKLAQLIATQMDWDMNVGAD